MDIKVKNKDILINDRGTPVMISGIKQVIQQIEFILAINRGSFIYDRNMGTVITKEVLKAENGIKTLQTLIYEGLINTPTVSVTVEYIQERDGEFYVGIIVNDGYETEKIEVILYE